MPVCTCGCARARGCGGGVGGGSGGLSLSVLFLRCVFYRVFLFSFLCNELRVPIQKDTDKNYNVLR